MSRDKQHRSKSVLGGSVKDAWRLYVDRFASILRATFAPLALITLLSWLTDDYTGNQYAVTIGLISVFNTMLLARLVTVGWDPRDVRAIQYYNGVMSRYFSGFGLLSLLALHCLPLLAAMLLLGIVFVGQIGAVWLVLILPLILSGVAIALHASFSIFALMDDMSLTVLQSLRISGRLARRYYRQILVRAGGAICAAIALGWILLLIGNGFAPYLQSAQTQLFVNAGLSWILTPLVFCYGAIVYKRLLEAYE